MESGWNAPAVRVPAFRREAVRSAAFSGSMTEWHWLLFYAAVAAAWCGLFGLIIPFTEWRSVGVYGWDLLFAVCSVGASGSGLIPLTGMWALMSAAMMLPTFVPALRCYEGLRSAGAGHRLGFAGLTAGYLAVWLGFSLLMAALQNAVHAGWAADFFAGADARNFAAALLLSAGLYQFSGLKEACLSKCRNPLAVFLTHWREGRFREPAIGLLMGAFCLGCCWLLMSFALISGTMSLIWMGLATIVMTVEKLPALGRYVSAPLGASLIAAAILVALSGQLT